MHAKGVILSEFRNKRQYFLAFAGAPLPTPYAHDLSPDHSVCLHVAEMGVPLVIDNAYVHPLLHGHKAVSELGVGSYFGVPVKLGEQTLVLCAFDDRKHIWDEDDRDHILGLARQLEADYSAGLPLH
ncbi:MAG: hypothetical protein CSA70_03395 [Rhodobacterales bacterium]|nr:MAG: hypothetical protein CSA70_03395 [Rhodobacterales bacterium]